MRKILLLLTIIVLSAAAHSQKVVGYWYGSANVQNVTANNYLVELVLKQSGSNVSGVLNYYFKNSFRSFNLTGKYNQATRQLNLFNIPVTYYASSASLEVDCMMDFQATLMVAKAGSTLNGKFVGKGTYKNTCPELIFDLKLNKEVQDQDSVLNEIRHVKEAQQVWKPSPIDTVIGTRVIQRPVVNFVITDEFKKRETVIADEIEVDSDSITVDFYDNGEIDGDSISVFFNKELIAFNRGLSTKSVHFSFGLDPSKDVNELTMFADNLGRLPPNTALMLVYDGRKRYDIRLSSNLQKNASVLIKRKKSGSSAQTGQQALSTK
ncbi:hypothetical protein V9K67_05310 [Paraflavisolibacter sp. H34]|uniref:hypothetical protein n=1 Tax=Huijunlia imazamoxiresistens TaxID=3127457 RepID=UPI003015B8CB